MSVIRLTKKHKKYGDAGTVVDRVPFLEARALVEAGEAERYNGGAGPTRPEAPGTVPVRAFEEAGRRVAALEAEVAALSDENKRLEAAAKKAADEAAALSDENKRLEAAAKKAANK